MLHWMPAFSFSCMTAIVQAFPSVRLKYRFKAHTRWPATWPWRSKRTEGWCQTFEQTALHIITVYYCQTNVWKSARMKPQPCTHVTHVHGFDTSVVTGAMEHLPCWPSATTTSYCWCRRSTWKEWRLVPFSWKPDVMQNGSKWCNCEKQILRCRGCVHRRGAACKRYLKKIQKTRLIHFKPLSHETHGPCDCGNVC